MQNPHVVSLNEVKAFGVFLDLRYVAAPAIAASVEDRVTWYRKYVQIGSKAGNALLSRLPVASSSTTLLSYDRGVSQMTIVLDGGHVNLFSTHVDYANASWRTLQTGEALKWISTFAEPRIVMGDFNTVPGTSELPARRDSVPGQLGGGPERQNGHRL